MNDRPTPETDAAWESKGNILHFARYLERERDEAMAKLNQSEILRDEIYEAAKSENERHIATAAERDELRAKLQYVADQLIEAGCDDGAAPIEELARRARKDIAGLRAEVERLKAVMEIIRNPMNQMTRGEICEKINAAMKGDK